MGQYTINVDDALDAILQNISTIAKLSKAQYAENIVHTFLEAQYRGKLKNDIDNKTWEEVKTYDIEKMKKLPTNKKPL